MIDDKTNIALLSGIIVGGLTGVGIAIIPAIASGQTVGSTIGGAVAASILNIRKLNK